MGFVRRSILLLGAAVLGLGCADDPGDTTRGGSGDPDDVPPPGTIEAIPANPVFAERTLLRARAWVDAEMPYCGGTNGGNDVICGGTCIRSGDSKKAEWDLYRSDCSGFVSWSWGLPAPGRSTSTFAPYTSDVSAVIAVTDLAPGDALNGKGHVMLWGGWVDERAGKALVLQESHCGRTANETITTFTKVDATTLRNSNGRLFRPIRFKPVR
jgi:hypothetical protein